MAVKLLETWRQTIITYQKSEPLIYCLEYITLAHLDSIPVLEKFQIGH